MRAVLHLDIEAGADQPVRPAFIVMAGDLAPGARRELADWAAKAFGSPFIDARPAAIDTTAPMTIAQGERVIGLLTRIQAELLRLPARGG